MSYEPTNWKSGDTITSAKLNKIEQGIASGGGGGGGALLIVLADEPMQTPPEWITEWGETVTVYETNVTYSQVSSAMTTAVLGLSCPGQYVDFGAEMRRQVLADFTDEGIEDGYAYITCGYYLIENSTLTKRPATLCAYGEAGALYFVIFQSI